MTDTDTFMAKNNASPMNLGCVVSPTAATALAPMELTISESTIPARAIKNDSHTAGHAILTASFVIPFSKPIIYPTPFYFNNISGTVIAIRS